MTHRLLVPDRGGAVNELQAARAHSHEQLRCALTTIASRWGLQASRAECVCACGDQRTDCHAVNSSTGAGIARAGRLANNSLLFLSSRRAASTASSHHHVVVPNVLVCKLHRVFARISLHVNKRAQLALLLQAVRLVNTFELAASYAHLQVLPRQIYTCMSGHGAASCATGRHYCQLTESIVMVDLESRKQTAWFLTIETHSKQHSTS
jgi:hypothetical protein